MKDQFNTHYDDDRYISPKTAEKANTGAIGKRWETPYCHSCGNTYDNCCCDDEAGDRDF